MSGLPPTGQNKVATRSKTGSFKRPISCDVTETKKDSKGLFFKLKKGSSNSRLDEETQYKDNSLFSENKAKTPNYTSLNNNLTNQERLADKIRGRNFESDDEDYELDSGETEVTKMENLFGDKYKVLKNPALVGYVLKYLLEHNLGYNSVLYYFIVQHYKSSIQNKDFQKEALRFITEIYTTFLHEKSVLKIDHADFKAINFEDLKSFKDFSQVFDESSKRVSEHCLTMSIDKLKSSIAHGLFTVDSKVERWNFEEKLDSFNSTIKIFIKSLERNAPHESNLNATKQTKEDEQNYTDKLSAVKSALATIYYYFSKKDKEDNSDNISIVSSKLNSLLGKSTENLQGMNNCILEKQPIFCSKIHKKPSSHSFFKKGKNLKGHSFQEKVFENPAECILCEKLLWGIAPQGFICSYCQGASHKGCKDYIKSQCLKDSGRYQRNSSILSQTPDDNRHKISTTEEKVINEVNIENVEVKDVSDKSDTRDSSDHFIQTESEHIQENGMEVSVSSLSSDTFQNTKPNSVISTATIIVTNNDDRNFENKFDSESLNSLPELHLSDKMHDHKLERDKMSAKKHLTASFVPEGHVKSIANKYDQKTIPRSLSDNDIESSTLPRMNKRPPDSVTVKDLIPAMDLLADDPDMKVGETFEADKELEAFPKYLTKDQDKAEYTRLLVLMEFHHKTKFTAMNLKLFKHYLIRLWPQDDKFLIKILSLDCIESLFDLIKTLADTIESCRNDSTYSSDIALKVLNWLTNDKEANLQKWLKNSINLCCTNSLHMVKNTWKDYQKSDARFIDALNARHKKMLMVEQLSNMRPLLFNFPLIISKLIKDLTKFSKFKDEAKIWKEIHQKFKLLPTFIDEHCMPLVQMVNNGTLINSMDRSSWMGKLSQSEPFYDYAMDFPKTIFHHKLIGFQEVKILSIKEVNNKSSTTSFVKDPIDGCAIFYEDIFVLLQKENDKYIFKQFKTSDASRINPVLLIENIHATGSETKNIKNSSVSYEMNIIFINVCVMITLSFAKKDIMERSVETIMKCKHAYKRPEFTSVSNVNNVEKQNDLNEETISVTKDDDKNENESREHYIVKLTQNYNEIKDLLNDYYSKMNEIELVQQYDKTIFLNPSDSLELVLGTIYDIGNILKLCNENFNEAKDDLRDDVLDQLISSLSIMSNRVSSYKQIRDKDVLNINDIRCTIGFQEKSQSTGDSPQESAIYIESEEPNLFNFNTEESDINCPLDLDESQSINMEISDINSRDLQLSDDIPVQNMETSDINSMDLQNQSSDEFPFQILDDQLSELMEEEHFVVFAAEYVENLLTECLKIVNDQKEAIESDLESDNKINIDLPEENLSTDLKQPCEE